MALTCIANKHLRQSCLRSGTKELQLFQFAIQRIIDLLHQTDILHRRSRNLQFTFHQTVARITAAFKMTYKLNGE